MPIIGNFVINIYFISLYIFIYIYKEIRGHYGQIGHYPLWVSVSALQHR